MGERSESLGLKDARPTVKGFKLTAFFVKVPSVQGIFDGTFSENDGSSSAFTRS